ncbi:adenosylcobinamide-GDP ribazoletransferase [Sphingobium sp. H39-3-25]|uniref:adenosylcobinamide-GDP ribazoletransferase n=1 Tax=Sphingobium arseniciresistens TaxID=3030834 RepID=UPI0023B9C0DB|nr:adenosylcobinamide-GDP ribazoletransferase [Sphingobium arseniciresistens]
MKRFIIALQFLTRLPTPRVTADDADFTASMRYFPAAGLVIGAAVAAAGWAGAWIHPWTGSLAALFAWVGITGALHLDGLADLADAKGALHKGRDRLLAVLADPHVGSFGVVAIAMQIAAKLVLLHGMIDTHMVGTLILVPAAARIGPLLWARWLPPLHDGLGARFAGAIRPVHIILWLVPLGAMGILHPALLATPIILAAWGWHLRRTIGGISGDGHGAGIETSETLLLVALLIEGRLA